MKYVETFKDRFGKKRFYFRRSKADVRISLPDPKEGKAEFDAAYKAASELDKGERQTGNIYIIEFLGWVKIGFSVKPASRLKELQTGVPGKASIVGAFAGTHTSERLLHSRFAQYREHGEWFRKEGSLAEWLENEFGVNASNPDKQRAPKSQTFGVSL